MGIKLGKVSLIYLELEDEVMDMRHTLMFVIPAVSCRPHQQNARDCLTIPRQKNLHHISIIIKNPTAANGPYCFSSNSQFILTAALLYFLLSSLSLWLMSPILSRLSPLYSKSSIFFVITFVTSLSSSFNLSRFCEARLSWYVFFVRCMNVSNSTNA